MPAAEKKPRRILCVDVGGSGLKAAVMALVVVPGMDAALRPVKKRKTHNHR